MSGSFLAQHYIFTSRLAGHVPLDLAKIIWIGTVSEKNSFIGLYLFSKHALMIVTLLVALLYLLMFIQKKKKKASYWCVFVGRLGIFSQNSCSSEWYIFRNFINT